MPAPTNLVLPPPLLLLLKRRMLLLLHVLLQLPPSPAGADGGHHRAALEKHDAKAPPIRILLQLRAAARAEPTSFTREKHTTVPFICSWIAVR